MNFSEIIPAMSNVIVELRDLLGDRLTTSQAIRQHHGHDESYLSDALPDAVAFPQSTEEVRQIVLICRRYACPVIAYGAGTSLEGHVLAVHGGVCLDMSNMNRILAVHSEDLDAVVQAGVTREALNVELKGTGLFFPVDPGANATLGGMAATRASGTNAVRYGTMRENVVSLEVVLADGRVIRTAGRARKSSAGYDLTRLFVGSEGTLGIITEVTVRLHAVPEAVATAVCAFESLEGCTRTVIELIQAAVPVARCELLCPITITAINAHSNSNHEVAPTVFFEFHGSDAMVAEQATLVQAIAVENGGKQFQWSNLPEERTRLWAARHMAYFACLQLRPGARAISTDVCVPISRLAECVAETAKDVADYIAPVPIVGHVGDGNFHLMLLIDPDAPAEIELAKTFNDRLVERAIRMEGTCTGEHGIGLGKMKSLRKERGDDAMSLLSDMKHAFDPENLMNPGKIVSFT
jgi:D-lactate dehydrogenase (cytochrome)